MNARFLAKLSVKKSKGGHERVFFYLLGRAKS